MTPRFQLRRSDAIAIVLWIAGAALLVTGITLGPEEQCEAYNHDQYVGEAHRAGIALLTAAVALTAAAAFLAAGPSDTDRRARESGTCWPASFRSSWRVSSP